MRVAEAVANVPCGGQIVMSGDTLASIASFQDLMDEVSHYCSDWGSCAPIIGSSTAGGAEYEPAAIRLASLGFHILENLTANQTNETFIQDNSREIIEIVPWPLRERVR